MTFNKTLFSLLILFSSLLLGLLFIEAGLRIYQFLGENSIFGIKPYKTTLEWIEHPLIGKVFFAPNQRGWFVTPSREYFNFLETNSVGLNDEEHSIKKSLNIYRILFLGDSFVASVQTSRNKTFFNQIEEKLNKESKDKKFEVIALGLGDTGTVQQYLALKEIGIKYKPDLVVHMFLTANDIKNNSPTLMQDPYRPYFVLDSKGNLKLLPHQQYSKRPNAGIKDVLKKSYLIELLLSLRQSNQEKNKNASLDYPVDYHVYDKKFNNEYLASWKVTQKLILETRNLVEKNSGEYILVTLANNEQVSSGIWEELKRTSPKMLEVNLDLRKPDKLISEFCEKEKISCLRLLSTFEKFARKNPDIPTHYRIDGHWTQAGTDIAASSIYNYLKGFVNEETISQ